MVFLSFPKLSLAIAEFFAASPIKDASPVNGKITPIFNRLLGSWLAGIFAEIRNSDDYQNHRHYPNDYFFHIFRIN